jgi:hypothetical protein
MNILELSFQSYMGSIIVIIIIIIIVCGGNGVWALGLTLAREVLYHLSLSTSPFLW